MKKKRDKARKAVHHKVVRKVHAKNKKKVAKKAVTSQNQLRALKKIMLFLKKRELKKAINKIMSERAFRTKRL